MGGKKARGWVGAWVAFSAIALASCTGGGGGEGRDGGGLDGGDVDGQVGPGDGGADAGALCTGDSQCDDGAYCNGPERCSPGDPAADASGCVPGGGDPCAVTSQVCSESTDTCMDACQDADGDGHLEASCGGDDCDDSNAARFPGNTEVCDAEGLDDDCNPSTLGPDGDGDAIRSTACCNLQGDGSLLCGTDCDDDNAEINPSAAEVCNGVDENCNGMADEGVLILFYEDQDGDGFGGADLMTPTVEACARPSGYSANNTDCDDTDMARHPGLAEVCDGVDNDCNDLLDAPDEDNDRDGFADSCAGLPVAQTDCNDMDALIYPGAPELCNGVDDDCDGSLATGEDADGDGQAATDAACAGGSLPKTDCDDGTSAVYDGALEACNNVDDDCDGTVDGAPATATCVLDNATAACVDGVCTVTLCTDPYLDCDMEDGNGCEVDSTRNDFFCGSCSLACTTSEYCSGSSCVPYSQWGASFGGGDLDYAWDVAHDGSGTTFVVGSFQSSSMTVGGAPALTNAGTEDAVVVALNPDDTVAWATSLGGTSSDTAYAVAVDGSGLYVSGHFGGTVQIGTTMLTSAGEYDVFVARLDAATGSPVWATSFGGTGVDDGGALAVDGTSGKVYVVGQYRSPSVTAGSDTLMNQERVPGVYNANIFVVQLAASDGAFGWTQWFGGSHFEYVDDVAVDASGDVYITGNFYSDQVAFDGITLVNTSAGDQEVFLARLAGTDGATVWAENLVGTTNGNDGGTGIMVSPGGTVLTTGFFRSATLGLGSLTLTRTSSSNSGYVAALDGADGTPLWATLVSTETSVTPQGITQTGTGTVYVAGSVWGSTITAGDLSAFTASSFDGFLLRVDPSSGTPTWLRALGGTDYDTAIDLASDATGTVFVAGTFRSTAFIVAGMPLTTYGSNDLYVMSVFAE